MDLKPIKTPEKKTDKPEIWKPTVNITLDTEQFPDIKGTEHKGDIKMIVEGVISRYESDEKGKETYTINIKKAGFVKKDTRQIKATSPEEEAEEGE